MIYRKREILSYPEVVVPYLRCPAKTFTSNCGTVGLGRSVIEHCHIVGEIARELLSRTPEGIRKAMFADNAPLVSAAHDIGKVSPYFVEKIRRACSAASCGLTPMPWINPDVENSWGGHAGVSQVAAREMNVPQFIPEILGQHHGFSPQVQGRRANDEVFGGPAWQKQREALVEELKSLMTMDWPHIESNAKARALAGLTSVSDWIGSGSFFENPSIPWKDQIKRAVDTAGYITPSFRQKLSFEDIFLFKPRISQEILMNKVVGPGVYILEAPMGIGKTEAALFAAYQLLETSKATGIYFALPTQLTSNKILERFEAFLSSILSPDCENKALLLHSNAWLVSTDMGEDGAPGGAWFNSSKRGLLAPFAVGTLDQALMAAMNVKHGSVRAFGLVGKVVILDEVHTYDSYTGTLLDALVDLLRSLECTVIILSATLHRTRREQLMGARLDCDQYPLLTVQPAGEQVQEISIPKNTELKISIKQLQTTQDAVDEAIKRAVDGQSVLWIENTVKEAQQIYFDIASRASECGIPTGLLHSRFTADDRTGIEKEWVNALGKTGWVSRLNSGRILVGTQVLEQSLDIDADFMITRFAPTDMLLQRVGRLWRHRETPRAITAHPEMCFLAPKLEDAINRPNEAFGLTAYVYSSYILCRSLEVWHDKKELTLPDAIRPMIDMTYCNRVEIGPMAKWLSDLEEGTKWRVGRKAMRQLANITLAKNGNTLPETHAQTRYSDSESCEVLLLRHIHYQPEEKTSNLTLITGEILSIPLVKSRLSRKEWRRRSMSLMKQIVRVAIQDAPQQVSCDILNRYGLSNCLYIGHPKNDEAILRVVLVDETGILRGIDDASVHERKILKYRGAIGYYIEEI